jgi:hypothetical protein
MGCLKKISKIGRQKIFQGADGKKKFWEGMAKKFQGGDGKINVKDGMAKNKLEGMSKKI